jgi:hypothetical protein
MADQTDEQKLELVLSVSDAERVKEALHHLSELSEPERRRVLRPHWEDPAGITDKTDLRLREGFDWALNQLAALELAASTGYLSHSKATGQVGHQMKKLLQSRAVARFIDDYDYFQVRFLASRMDLQEFKLPPLPDIPALSASPETDTVVSGYLRQTLTLQNDEEFRPLYGFLDNLAFPGMEKSRQHERFRLWLADSGSEQDEAVRKHFETLKRAIAKWVMQRSEIYRDKPEALQARFAIFDIYWLLKLFDAEISTLGDVAYCGSSWLTLVAASPHFGDNRESGERIADIFRTGYEITRAQLLDAKRTLRRALGLACDWIRGEAIEEEPGGRTARIEKEEHAPVSWVDAFRDELREISEHRQQSHLGDASTAAEKGTDKFKVRHGLIGLAFSGGGIRSATFNLGVLEALKENDLLRYVDYLSTVSGGGYIGGWLVANAKRRGYWVRREADWHDSVKHLRDYSNYLSPHLGFMSPDTWSMWTTFLRNTILVQFQIFLAIAACLLLPYLVRFPFNALLHPGVQSWSSGPEALSAVLLAVVIVLVCASLLWPRKPPRRGAASDAARSRWWIPAAVFVFVVASLSTTAVIWRTAANIPKQATVFYSDVLLRLVDVVHVPEMRTVLAVAYVALALVAFASSRRQRGCWLGILIAPAGALATLLLAVSALVLLVQRWVLSSQSAQEGWILGRGFEHAFVFGPVLVLGVLTLSIYILIGLLGRASDRQPREWWSRFGALLMMTGTGWLALSVAAVYSPRWIDLLKDQKLDWIPMLAWLATSGATVLAGNSGATSGEGSTQGASKTSKALEALMAGGPLAAIAGIVVAISGILHAALLFIGPTPTGDYWQQFGNIDLNTVGGTFIAIVLAGLLLTWRVDINIFGLSEFYRIRLVRCYLGATRSSKRRPHPFTGFDEGDDLLLASLRTEPPAECGVEEGAEDRAPFAGPFPIVNCTLNLGGSSDLAVKTRQSDCFTMTPLHCGYNHRSTRRGRVATGGYAPTLSYCGRKQSPTLGLAVAISGAAASPNMGYHTSPLASFLMTAFNARLGCWFANPAHKPPVTRFSPPVAFPSLLKELIGTANDESSFVAISDGGHFENLGVYELVRRRCRLIIASDAECDPDYHFEGLGKVIRLCEVDFDAKIKIDVSSIRPDRVTGRSKSHCAVGRIEYGNGGLGTLIYIKASLLDEENTSVLQYYSEHHSFPHETTANQFFTEDQFESYRKLGYDCAKRTLRDVALENNGDVELERFTQELTDIWTPVKNLPASFISSTRALSKLWEKLGTDPALSRLSNEIITHTPPPPVPALAVTSREFYFCNEIIQLMENVHLDLKLDDTWDDPDNAGWKDLFLKCSRSSTFRIVWEKSRGTYGKRFHYFCRRKLNLK